MSERLYFLQLEGWFWKVPLKSPPTGLLWKFQYCFSTFLLNMNLENRNIFTFFIPVKDNPHSHSLPRLDNFPQIRLMWTHVHKMRSRAHLIFYRELAILTLHFWAAISCLVITSGTWMQCLLRTSLHFTYKVQWRTLLSQGSPLLAARWFSWGKSSPPVVVTPLCQWCHWCIHIWVLSTHYPDLN